MASSIIHIVVANELNKKLNRDSSKYLLGAIAPDIAKMVGETKVRSHFLEDNTNQVPRLDWFLDKYKDDLKDDFVLGYFIHLCTDYLWFKYFMSEISNLNMIKTLDGDIIRCSTDKFCKYIYNDYTNMNIQLIDKYNLDLKIFYNDIPYITQIIEEIPMNKLYILRDKVGIIIENSTKRKDYVFDITNVNQFIQTAVELVESNLRDLGLIE